MCANRYIIGMKSIALGFVMAFFGLFSAVPGRSQSPISGLPSVRNFNTLDYKAGIQNWSIAQDSRGIMYIANNLGLLEYDGNRWRVYAVKNGSKIRSVAVDGSGKIYVGCQGEFGYFFPGKQGELEYTSLADSLPDKFRNFDETWNLFLDDGKVYFCTFSNIFIYDHNAISIVQPERPAELSFFVNRELLVNVRGLGLTKLQNDRLTLMEGGGYFKDIGISSVLNAYDNQYLISTFREGIYLMNSSGEVKPWNESLQQYFRQANINCMVRLKNGNYAIGTQNFGLFILTEKGETLLHLTSGQGLENRTVLSLLEDDLQNLWVGNNNGLAYIELGSSFTEINEEMGLPGTGYSSYLTNSHLYLGTNTGLYVRSVTDKTQAFKFIEGTRGQVYHIGKYGDDLLMGHHNGAFRIDGDKATLISPVPGSWIFLLPKNAPGVLIGGAYDGLQFFTRKDGHWALSGRPDGFTESSRIMEQDRDGNLWITHGYKGVYKLDLDLNKLEIKKVSYYGADKGFPSNILINVYALRNQLVFTSEHGVYRFDKQLDRFALEPLFTTLLGENSQLLNIREDAIGNVYFIGHEMIGVMRKNSVGSYDVDQSSFKKIRRFLNDDLENLVILKNNEVLFGAKEGFIHYDPNIKMDRKSNIKTHIRQFSTTGDTDSVYFHGNFVERGKVVADQGKDNVIELPYAQNSANFTYAATSFESDGEIVHQYYLEKFDKTWSHWDVKSQKEYTNLHEGKYTFHVRSKNVYGEISSEATYRFVVLPPWYRTALAYTGYTLCTMMVLFSGFVLLDRKYKYERRAMVLRQKKELIRKDNELEIFAQKTQEEITRLEHEKLEAELRHMNKELGTSTVLILNKNEFISSVKDNLKSISNKSGDDGVSKELSRIVHDIEGNLSSDADWEHFQVHFDKVHGDFSRTFRVSFPNLSPQEMKLSAYLRMNLSTKEIANLLNISIRGVEISRYRLRKKLKLDRSLNLQEFILNF